tara:strand:+ start:144 stop:608 length:465 start_codon:yes stop_codon:yes gene_type:complete
MKKKMKKIVFKAKVKAEKQRICIRFPEDTKLKLKERAEKDYKGRGKQSELVEDAIKYFLYCAQSVNWQNYEKDTDYLELIDDISEGLNQSNLGSPTQVFLTTETVEKLTQLETRVILSKPSLRDSRTGLIRKAVSIRLSIESKGFFDNLMSLDE